MAGWGRNDDAKSMTHPTDGTCGHNAPCPRRGVHDSIRDGANRIDAREPLSCAAAAGRLPQQTHRADISRANLAQTLALFLQKSFAISGGQELGIDSRFLTMQRLLPGELSMRIERMRLFAATFL